MYRYVVMYYYSTVTSTSVLYNILYVLNYEVVLSLVSLASSLNRLWSFENERPNCSQFLEV
jgi:hypothetical protein